MDLNELLSDLFTRIDEHIHEAVDGLQPSALITSPAPDANTIGWQVWHLTRVQDHHMAAILGEEQVWMVGDWPQRFGLTAEPDNTGYGHSVDQMLAVRPADAQLLIDYYDAVAARTKAFIANVTADELDRIVDKNWDPPVTLGVRLISIADDDIQHAAQASYTRGILDRR